VALEIAKTVSDVRQLVERARRDGLTIGLVPTMGALHAGHASLITAARNETGFVVVSIFVNPTQFGPNEDFGRYPRTWEEDLAVCEKHGADAVFAPAVEEVYPARFSTYVEVAKLQDGLCGRSRPEHFRGVTTVVLKLFNITSPDLAYFGQKDAQQARIIRQLVRDLNLTVTIRMCPIVREPDGLAMSSRNRHLSLADRKNATVLYRALEKAKAMIERGERDAALIRKQIVSMIASTAGAEIDYAEVVDEDALQPVSQVRHGTLIALAVKFGTTRLIDNLLWSGP
jgi:pantoate--beta-alanine ligase